MAVKHAMDKDIRFAGEARHIAMVPGAKVNESPGSGDVAFDESRYCARFVNEDSCCTMLPLANA